MKSLIVYLDVFLLLVGAETFNGCNSDAITKLSSVVNFVKETVCRTPHHSASYLNCVDIQLGQ